MPSFGPTHRILASTGGSTMSATECPCASGHTLADCCAPLHQGLPAPTAERLMRSRYSAYTLGLIDYLVATTLPAQQAALDRTAMAEWSANSQWLGLDVRQVEPVAGDQEHAFVTFIAHWQDASGVQQQQERSAFVRVEGRWYFIDPTVALDVGRNDPCPCQGGKKFKKCCSPYF